MHLALSLPFEAPVVLVELKLSMSVSLLSTLVE